MSDVTLLICGADRRPVVDPVSCSSLTAEIKFNAAGTVEAVARADPPLVSALYPDPVTFARAALVATVLLDGDVFASGPIEKPGALTWTPDAGVGTVRINASTWEAWLGGRLTYPDPTAAADAQPVATWAVTATNAETVMRQLVDGNLGPGALAARQLDGLVLGAVAGVGASVDFSTRFEVLADALRKVATAGGGLGFRIAQQADRSLQFQVYGPADRSASVRFSRSLGNLLALSTDPEAPTATVAIVGGDGTGTSRTIVERSAADALAVWGRWEQWVNQSGTSPTTTEIQQAGDAALVAAGEKAGISCTAVDGPQARYGRDYWLGDTVALEVVPGVAVTDVVSAVKLTYAPDKGVVVSPTIGATTAATSRQVRQIRALGQRIDRLERD